MVINCTNCCCNILRGEKKKKKNCTNRISGNLTVEVACSEAVYCEFTQLISTPEGVVVGPQVS